MKSVSHQSYTSTPQVNHHSKTSLRYKENVAALFEKLNSLQHCSEAQKSVSNAHVVLEFNQKESRVQEQVKQKSEQFKNILRAVGNIEK